MGWAIEKVDLITAPHQFRIGSITKLFTAAINLQLIAERLLKLDDFYFLVVEFRYTYYTKPGVPVP